MLLFNTASVRTAIDVANTTDLKQRVAKGDPNALTTDGMQALLASSALVLDGLRVRPRYFDGRFLTGADLTRDQTYVDQRQADLARATGTGVVSGLQVYTLDTVGGRGIQIAAGEGITPAGDLVLVSTTRQITLDDIPASERLDAAMGLRVRPSAPLARRTGLFLLALRPIEFTANPIASYPTTISGARTAQDGDIIEGTAITLIPYPDLAGAASLDDARRRVARSLFVDGVTGGLPQEALPLAMLALDRGVIRWLDMAMVRREIGADTPLQVAIGARPRALAEAHVLQYQAQLMDVLNVRSTSGVSGGFPASQYFAALPAAGQMPADAIATDSFGFTQLYFAPSMPVDISFVPHDEVPALIEESLALPPIDLLAAPDDLDNTGVVVLAPVTRAKFQDVVTRLDSLSRTASNPAVRTAARRLPVDVLGQILQRRALVLAPPPSAAETAAAASSTASLSVWQAAWQEAVAALPAAGAGQPRLLWFLRRRTVAYDTQISGVAVVTTGDDAALAAQLTSRLSALGLQPRVDAVSNRATPFAAARIASLLGAPRIVASDLLLTAAVRQLELATAPPAAPGPPTPTALPPTATPAAPTGAATPVPTPPAPVPPTPPPAPVTETQVLAAADAFGDPRLGDGLDRVLAVYGTPAMTPSQVVWLAGTGEVPALDSAARNPSDAAMPGFAAALRASVGASDIDSLNRLIAGS
jgi:hypothetical protein